MSTAEVSRWPRRWSYALCALTFPLICVGGLITTTDAGMAVPDWPGTYGSNMFLYPWETWFFGPWDLFIEHGHRLLGALVGLVSIGLLVTAYRSGAPRGFFVLCVLAVLLVAFQGALGGLRVLANERLLAMAHGVTGPLFFALTGVLVAKAAPSRRSKQPSPVAAGRLAATAALLTLVQLALGAGLRHIPETAVPWTFATIVRFHLLGAAVVATCVLWWAARSLLARGWPLRARLVGLVAGGIVLAQLAAGVATWVLKYGVPGWADGLLPTTISAVVANGWWQKHVVTAHQAGGSLLLGVSAFVAARFLAAPNRSAAEPHAPSP